MKNTVIQLNATYLVYGTRTVKVVKVTDRYIEVKHAINGMTPRRFADRYFPLHTAKHFVRYEI